MPGRLWQLDSEGFILNDARGIQPPFVAVVNAAVSAYTSHLADDIHSIYVTGSVARGLAVPGESDLNICAVLNETTDPDLVLRDWTYAAEEALLAAHDVITNVRLELVPYTFVLGDPAYFSIDAFILKTESICVWGSDLTSELLDYPISPHIANHDIVQFVDDLHEAIDELQAYPRRVRSVCHRAAKQLLHTGFSLVMLDAGVYTRDLDLSYQYFTQHYPHLADDMRRALEFAPNPPQDVELVSRYLTEFGGTLVAEADQWLDKHNPERLYALPTDEVEAAD